MSSSYSRTTKTYQYSSRGGPGQISESRTVTYTGPDGRTETKTYSSNDREGSHIGIDSRFGGMDINFSVGGGMPGGRVITRQRNNPVERSSRYSKGWGSRKERPSEPMQLTGKTYAEIKAECLSQGRLFEDPDFPAVDKSIYYSRAPNRPFAWKRPTVSIYFKELYSLRFVSHWLFQI